VRRFSITPIRLAAIYLLGLMAGAQAALYLYDRFDDGVSEPLSGGIAILFLLAGIALMVGTIRGGAR
jgi:hypothetical protein